MLFRIINRLFILSVLCILTFRVRSATSDADIYLSRGSEALTVGNNQQAIEFYQQGLQLIFDGDTENAALITTLSLYTNLATAYSAIGKDEAAAQAYQNALTFYKENGIGDSAMHSEAASIAAQAAFFLGMVYQDLGHAADAVDAYTAAQAFDPLHWASFANLGSVLHDSLSDHSRALTAYYQAYSILTDPHGQEPTDPPPEPSFILSQLQYRIGLCLMNHDTETRKCVIQQVHGETTVVDCRLQAAHSFSLAVEYDPTNEAARHMLATTTADATMKRAANTYIATLFDYYAATFEHSLVQELGYTGYERLRRGYDRARAAIELKEPLDLVVDAGCGTGLVGEQFRNISRVLIGVDLSAAILTQGERIRPGLYDETRVGDVMNVFQELKDSISLIVAADSYIYFGDLVPLFEAMYDGLRPGGIVAFTLENVSAESEIALVTSKPDWKWQLTASGRFAHRKAYVESVCIEHALTILLYETLDGFRFEHGVAVRGHLFVLQKHLPVDTHAEKVEL
jgi:predicted TPR repeat methyltransferase